MIARVICSLGGVTADPFVVALCAAARAGDWDTARRTHERWLPLFLGNFSGAPNFAYDLCVARTSAEERARLNEAERDASLNSPP